MVSFYRTNLITIGTDKKLQTTMTVEFKNPLRCRFCRSRLHHTFVDLGMSPLCESFLMFDQLNQMEPFYPLHVYVCEKCFLVQLEEYVSPEHIFTDIAYFFFLL